MSLRKYPEYKDSGAEWLGPVPSHWNIVQSRRYFAERKEKARDSDRQLTASQKHGVMYQDAFSALEGQKVVQVILGADILKHVEPNDFVISMRSFQGGIEWSGVRGSISSAYVMLIPADAVHSGFFRYLFKSKPYIQALQTTTNLVRDGQALRFNNFVQVPLPLLPIDEQAAVADFLDCETAKIDALIAEQEQLLALLAEKRQATISHAVTRGLDPDVPMKGSDVPWLGEVPAHWGVRSLKSIVSTPITDGPHETPAFLDQGVPFVSAEAVSGGVINFEKVRAYISEEDDARYSQKYRPQLHDIYMVKSGATTGVTAIVDGRTDFNIWSPLAAIRCDQEVALPHFVMSYLRSKNFQEGVALNWSFGTQQNIGMGVLGDLPVALPPLEEQREITQFLEKQLNSLGDLQKAAEHALPLLRERRSALIAAAVTGQIDVRATVEPLATHHEQEVRPCPSFA